MYLVVPEGRQFENYRRFAVHLDRANKDIAQQAGLAASYVNMSEDEAGAVSALHFGIEGPVTRFATEKDDTFRVGHATGPRFVLKVANPSESESEIAIQIELLEYLAARTPELPVPRIVPNRLGQRSFEYEDRSGQIRRIRLMSYLEGTSLSETSSSAGERRQVGSMLARLRLAMADFEHPADTRVLPWDIKHLLKLEGLLSEFSDEGQRRQLVAGLERFARMERQMARCRTQVVHNDFSKSNIVVNHALPTFVSGVIDFGDAVRTSIAIDVSTALLNQLSPDGEDLFRDAHDLLRGYLAVADLTNEELSLVPHLVMGRVIARTLLTTWRANMFPSNSAYILRNTQQGWAQLDWFLARSVEQVSDEFQAMFV